MRHVVMLAAVLVAGGAVAAAMAAEPKSLGLRGGVYDAGVKPVVGVWVEARRLEQGALAASDFEGAPVHAMRSDPLGLWVFPELGEGTWVVTAVAGTQPRTDEELQQCARPGEKLPADVAVSRVIRHLDEERGFRQERIDIGLALGSTTDAPLRGRLTGVFAPERFAYELRLRHTKMTRGGAGETTITFSFSGNEPSPVLSTVPDREGRFDFGGFAVSEYEDTLEVASFALGAADADLEGQVCSQQVVTFANWKDGVEVPLPTRRVVTLHATGPDGVPLKMHDGTEVNFTIWDEHGTEMNFPGEGSARQEPLPDGTYLVRADDGGEQASTLTTLTLSGLGEVPPITLALQPCPPFTVHFIDQHGVPLAWMSLKLGTEATAAFPTPCRIRGFCKDGVCEVRGLFPGTYDAELSIGDGKPPFAQRLVLKPGDAPIVVNLP
jgi:hypothetical protein